MNEEKSSRALVLKSTPFKENKVILYLFTEELGPISAITTTKKSVYLSSLMLIEGTLKKSRGDMFNLTNTHILNTFPQIRKDFDLLRLAMQMTNTLSKTLVKDKPTAPLFTLTKNTLAAFAPEKNNKAIYLCFLLKLLLFEGLLPLNPTDINTRLNDTEKDHYLTLATTKDFKSLHDLSITPSLERTIEEFIVHTIH